MNNYIGVYDYLTFLEAVLGSLTSAAVNEEASQISNLVWSELISNLMTLDDLFCEYGYSNDYLTENSETENDGDILTGLRTFAISYLQQMYSVVHGYNSTDTNNDNITELRPQVIMALIQMGDETAISAGELLYEQQIAYYNYSLAVVDPNLITCILSAALATNKPQYFNQITTIIYPSVQSTQQMSVLAALSALYVSNNLTNRAIEFVLSDNVNYNVKMQGLDSCRRCKGRFNVWGALIANNGMEWDSLAAIYGSGFAMSALTAVFSTFASDTMLNNVESFYSSDGRTTSGNSRVVNQTTESISNRAAWLENHRSDVQLFLKESGNYTPSPSSNSSKKWVEEWWFILSMVLVSLITITVVVLCIVRRRRKKTPEDYQKINENEITEY